MSELNEAEKVITISKDKLCENYYVLIIEITIKTLWKTIKF